MSKHLAIIGAGAAGLSAAVQARIENHDLEITLFEKMPKAAKKISATGNGRCNFTNENLSPSHFYGNSAFLKSVLTSPFADSENFFRSLGVFSYKESGRIYPRSQQASTIRDALTNFAVAKNITVKTDSPILSIKKANGLFEINNERFDAVIVSGGGKASPVHGSDGSAYKLLTEFGHRLTPLYPALCGLVPNENINLLKGVRAECRVELYSKGCLLGEEYGEVQFTEKSVSGIPVMNLSHLCKNNTDLKLVCDLCYGISYDELSQHINTVVRNRSFDEFESVLNGIVNLKLGYAIMNKCGIKPRTVCRKITSEQIQTVVNTLKNFKINIKGTRGFDNAQVTCGGINTDGFDPKTMMSKIETGLFACGEILDIHGDCGGYNLHLAWTSGRIAGCSAAEYLKQGKQL